MEASSLKNMVILKNLPSNLVEEAIVILKQNKKIKNIEIVEKSSKKSDIKPDKKEKDYILKEAEMLVNQYIKQIETKKEMESKKKKSELKYKKMRRNFYIATVISIFEFIMILFK